MLKSLPFANPPETRSPVWERLMSIMKHDRKSLDTRNIFAETELGGGNFVEHICLDANKACTCENQKENNFTISTRFIHL